MSAAAGEQANRWRHHEIDAIDHQLGLHWTRTVLDAARDDHPLAYGPDHLRTARRFLTKHPEAGRPVDLDVLDTAVAQLDAIQQASIPVPTRQPERGLDLGLSL